MSRHADDVLLIVGHPRSGTTLLAEQMGRIGLHIGEECHVFLLPEVRAWLKARPRPAAATLLQSHARLRPYRKVAAALDKADIKDRLDLFTALMAAWRDHTGAPLAADKTPNHWPLVPRLLHRLPGARVIYCIRDPRDVVDSNRKVHWGQGDDLVVADAWRRIHKQARRDAARQPHRVRIHYHERFLRDPDAALAEYADWLGLPAPGGETQVTSFDPDAEPWKHQAAKPPDPEKAYAWKKSRAGGFRYRRIEALCAAELAHTPYVGPKAPARPVQVAGLRIATLVKRIGRDIERRVWIE